MGGAKRYPSMPIAKMMGFAKGSTHPTKLHDPRSWRGPRRYQQRDRNPPGSDRRSSRANAMDGKAGANFGRDRTDAAPGTADFVGWVERSDTHRCRSRR